MKRLSVSLVLLNLWVVLCSYDRLPDTNGNGNDKIENEYTKAIPIDFSYVGYRKGEAKLPLVKTIITLEAPADGADATEMIQKALDAVPAPGAVLLKAGEYNVAGNIKIRRNGVVLRGEGEQTRLIAKGDTQRDFITLGISTSRALLAESSIVEDAYVGQIWVKVENSAAFAVGDRVAVFCEPNDKWVTDLKMDQIKTVGTNVPTQWGASKFAMYWEREVVRIEGDKVWLDCPLVSDFVEEYTVKRSLYKISVDRVEESGIEDMFLISDYDKSNEFDENHAWTAVYVSGAENCWIRGVKSAHFGLSLARIGKWGRCITVKDCESTAPISVIGGSRRYAFYINGGQMCLFENCKADQDRHGFITSSRIPGPNVFLDCVMTNAHSVVGPHHRWATGLLYDCCPSGIRLEANDRAHYGSGHGWPAVNCVFWNCTADKIDVMSPWIGGKNYSIGCIGEIYQKIKYKDGLKRPDAVWMSHGQHVEPRSLYRTQLANRIKNRK